MVESFVPAFTTITWAVWPLGKPATARGDPTGRASRMRPSGTSFGGEMTSPKSSKLRDRGRKGQEQRSAAVVQKVTAPIARQRCASAPFRAGPRN